MAKELTKKNEHGKVKFLTLTAGQISKVITSTEDFISALEDFLKLAKEKEQDFPQLKSIPLTKEKIDKLNSELKKIKDLPF